MLKALAEMEEKNQQQQQQPYNKINEFEGKTGGDRTGNYYLHFE